MAAPPARGGTLRVAISDAPVGFDPAIAPRAPARLVMEQVYSSLTRLDVDGNPLPGLAEDVREATDGRSWTVRLRRGARFHDGTPVTAEDVRFSLERIRRRERDYTYWAWVEAIAGVTVLDQLTVRLDLSRVCAALPVWLAFAGTAIVSRRGAEAGLAIDTSPMGTGPFRWAGHPAPGVIRLERNEAFHGAPAPHLDALEFHVMPDPSARAAALRSGRVDFADGVAAADWVGLTAAPGVTGAPVVDGRYHWLMLNTALHPFGTRAVRQAIAHAIDRTAIAQRAFAGHAEPITGGWVAPWSWAAAPDLPRFAAAGDRDQARALLAEAGLPDGFHTRITVGTGVPSAEAQAAVVAEALAGVGITADVVALDQPRYLDVVWRDRQYEMSVMCWASPLSEPDDFVGGQFRWGTRNNVEQYSATALPEMIDSALEVSDRDRRRTMYREIQALALVECPRIPTVFPATLRAHTDRLRGYVPLRNGSLASLSDAWLAE